MKMAIFPSASSVYKFFNSLFHEFTKLKQTFVSPTLSCKHRQENICSCVLYPSPPLPLLCRVWLSPKTPSRLTALPRFFRCPKPLPKNTKSQLATAWWSVFPAPAAALRNSAVARPASRVPRAQSKPKKPTFARKTASSFWKCRSRWTRLRSS